jgi:hypothetical protein
MGAAVYSGLVDVMGGVQDPKDETTTTPAMMPTTTSYDYDYEFSHGTWTASGEGGDGVNLPHRLRLVLGQHDTKYRYEGSAHMAGGELSEPVLVLVLTGEHLRLTAEGNGCMATIP